MIKDGLTETSRNKAIAYVQQNQDAWAFVQGIHDQHKEDTDRIKALEAKVDKLTDKLAE